MYFPSPQSSPERQTESPEYMDIEGFEGFFHETTERRMVEFEGFILDSDNVDTAGGELDNTKDDVDAELQEDSEGEELLLLKEVLSFKDEVKVGVNYALQTYNHCCSIFERVKESNSCFCLSFVKK